MMTDILTSASALLARVTKLLQSISEASAHFLRLFGCIMPRKPGTQALLCADDKDKNAGTKNIASKVPLSMPPNTPVPIAC